jgi:uncharacterized protein (DUF736 family)
MRRARRCTGARRLFDRAIADQERTFPMHIGSFQKIGPNFVGRIHTLGLDLALAIVPAGSSDADDAPDWRVHVGENELGPEAGAGWDRTGDKAGRYISLQLDGPTLVHPIRARLFRSEQHNGLHQLVWTRPQPQAEKQG